MRRIGYVEAVLREQGERIEAVESRERTRQGEPQSAAPPPGADEAERTFDAAGHRAEAHARTQNGWRNVHIPGGSGYPARRTRREPVEPDPVEAGFYRRLTDRYGGPRDGA
jgi:hypothetical protein